MRFSSGAILLAMAVGVINYRALLGSHDTDCPTSQTLTDLAPYRSASNEEAPYSPEALRAIGSTAFGMAPYCSPYTRITWLVAPTGSGLPPLAVAMSDFGKSSGFLCLMTAEGKPVASTNKCGMVQAVYAVKIAPLENPQLLVLGNTSRGTGSAGGELILFEVSGSTLREILRASRYCDRDILGEAEFEISFPLMIGSKPPCSTILIPSVRFTESNPVRVSGIQVKRFEWSTSDQRYLMVNEPGARPLIPPGIWDWTGDDYMKIAAHLTCMVVAICTVGQLDLTGKTASPNLKLLATVHVRGSDAQVNFILTNHGNSDVTVLAGLPWQRASTQNFLLFRHGIPSAANLQNLVQVGALRARPIAAGDVETGTLLLSGLTPGKYDLIGMLFCVVASGNDCAEELISLPFHSINFVVR